MDCHKCQHNGKGSTACLSCKGPSETNHKGRSHVSIDAGGNSQTMGEVEASISVMFKDVKSKFPRIHPDAAKVALAFLSMDDADFRLVKALLGGKTMASVAREAGLTRAAVSAQVKRLAVKHPVFSFLRR